MLITRGRSMSLVSMGIAALMVTSCSNRRHSTSLSTPGQATTTIGVQSGPIAVDCGSPSSINHLVNHDATVGIVGQVTRVDSPKWNSADGSPWSGSSSSPGVPRQYRDASVSIQRVLFAPSASNSDVRVGSTISIRVLGDGSNTGEDGCSAPGLKYNDADGPIAAGDTILALLGRFPFGTQTGTDVVWTFADDSYGLWTLANNSAKNPDPERVVPADQLIQRIQHERARGFDASETPQEADMTRRNPLGAQTASSPSTTLVSTQANPTATP